MAHALLHILKNKIKGDFMFKVRNEFKMVLVVCASLFQTAFAADIVHKGSGDTKLEAYLNAYQKCLKNSETCYPTIADFNKDATRYLNDECELDNFLYLPGVNGAFTCRVEGSGDRDYTKETKIIWGSGQHLHNSYPSIVDAYNECKNKGFKCDVTPQQLINRVSEIEAKNHPRGAQFSITSAMQKYLTDSGRCVPKASLAGMGYYSHCYVIGTKQK